MGEQVIPNLEAATRNCLDCNAVRNKVRVRVGEIACANIDEAHEVEAEWGDYVALCTEGNDMVGKCGTEKQECGHPDGAAGVTAWRPSRRL